MTDDPTVPDSVIDAFALDRASLEPLVGGLINTSLAAQRSDGQACVVQRVNPIFPPEVHQDIEAVTRHLESRDLPTPLLLPTQTGELHVESNDQVWRVLTRIEGESHHSVASDAMAREAGRVLGAFHAALADFDAELASKRPGVHDIARHLVNLERAIAEHPQHSAHAEVTRLAVRINKLVAELPPLPDTSITLVHGDPKISNVIFAGDSAVCLVDLDTLARQPVALEIGDALRSWCNPESEDSPLAHFSVDRYAAVLEGYTAAAGQLFDATVRMAVADTSALIALELATRFAADALNESYFNWDQQHFASAAEHNLARAAAQQQLAESMIAVLPEMRRLAMTQS